MASRETHIFYNSKKKIPSILETLETFVWWRENLPVSKQKSANLLDFAQLYLCYFVKR